MSHYEKFIDIAEKQKGFLKQIDYIIERKNDLGLCFKTFIENIGENYERLLMPDDIEICYFDKDSNTRYTIATFDNKENYHYLNIIKDRLQLNKINIDEFYELVKLGIDICNNKSNNKVIKEFNSLFSCSN